MADSSDDDVPTAEGARYRFVRPNLATSVDPDGASKVRPRFLKLNICERPLLGGTFTLTSRDPDPVPSQAKTRTMTAIELERANLAKVKASSVLVKRFGYHERVERGREPSTTSRTAPSTKAKENLNRDDNVRPKGEWDSWDIPASDGTHARASKDIEPWRTPARRLAECETAATEAMDDGRWADALALLLRCVPLAKAHYATASAVGGALTRAEATALSRAHFNIAHVYERSRGLGLYKNTAVRASSNETTSDEAKSKINFRRERDFQAAELDGLAEAVTHLQLSIASATVLKEEGDGGDSAPIPSDAVVRGLAECKLRARTELGPRLLAIGRIADAAEVARRGLASCATDESRTATSADDGEGAKVGTRRDVATLLFLAGDCERALGEAATEAAAKARKAKKETAERHALERKAAMDAAVAQSIAESEAIAADARQKAARAGLYERTSATWVEEDKARREKDALLAKAFANKKCNAEKAAREAPVPTTSPSLHNDYKTAAAFVERREAELVVHERARLEGKAEAKRRFESAEAFYERAKAALEVGATVLDADLTALHTRLRSLHRARRDWGKAAETCETLLKLAEANGGGLPGTSHDDGDAIATLQSELADLHLSWKRINGAVAWATRAVETLQHRALRDGAPGGHSVESIRARVDLAAIVMKSGDVISALDAHRRIVKDVDDFAVFPEDSAGVAECLRALGGACFAASDRVVPDDDDQGGEGGGGDENFDDYDDAKEERLRSTRESARVQSLALLSEAAAVYERAASIVRAIEGVGSAAYEELMVRMDLVDDAIAEEKRARREDREKAGL